MKVVITAGGKGTRIASLFGDIPKPMIPICGVPIIEHQINCLKEQGYDDIIITLGYLGTQIKNYFKDGSMFGVKIEYYFEEEVLGTAGALVALKEKLTEDFFLINGDIIFDIDLNRMENYHKHLGGYATLATHPNGHPYDSAIINADKNGIVTKWLNKEDKRNIYKNRVNAGIHILSPILLNPFNEIKKLDLDRDVLKPNVRTNKIYIYDTPEYIHDAGTPDRFEQVTKDVAEGIVKMKNLKMKQKAVFLDRDGVINKYKGFITVVSEIELNNGVASAIRAINISEWLAIVITNQPVIARGDCTWDELDNINNYIETLLGVEGSFINDIFICPHHPDKGFNGEVVEYKIECECRKPKPGLLFQAAAKYNIDLSESFMVGDSLRDIEAGLAAGCTPIFIGNNADLVDKNVACFESLKDFIDKYF